MGLKRKPRKRVPKESRQNLQLWAEGAREDILKPHIELYANTLDQGWRAEREYLQTICNEFHAKVSWRLQDHEEPELPLTEYDPLAEQPEEELEEADKQAKRAQIEQLNAVGDDVFIAGSSIASAAFEKLLRATRLNPAKDPWAVFLAQLSNIKAPPKACQAYQQFMRKKYQELVAPVVDERWPLSQMEVFVDLPQEEWEAYAVCTKAEAAEARNKFDADMKKTPSKAPQDRQVCIDRVGTFLAPILQGIHERTGLHATVILGGPMPNYSGDLKAMYVSYVCTKNGGAHFPNWAKDRWNIVLDLMKEYLAVAFNKQDQEEATLPDDMLVGTKYTMPDVEEGDGSDSDSSDSNSDSDSNHESNRDSDDDNAPPAKTRRVTKASSAKGKAKAVAIQKGLGHKGTRDGAQEEMEGGGRGKKKRLKAEETLTGRGGCTPSTPQSSDTPSSEVTATASHSLPLGTRRPDAPRPASPATATTTTPSGTCCPDAPRPASPPTATPTTTTNEVAPPPTTLSSIVTMLTASGPSSSTATAPAPAPLRPSVTAVLALPRLDDQTEAVPPTMSVNVPATAPKWLWEAVSDITRVDLGCHYTAVVTALERLQVIADWIKVGRGTKSRKAPVVANIVLHVDQWDTWWSKIQPGWRERDANGRWHVDAAYNMTRDWGKVECYGVNWLLSAVGTLYFWGVATRFGPEEQRVRWEQAVNDVVWVLEGLEKRWQK
ncbi:hypothetical protein C8R45DRAFT_948411 [Mycena sanguinolenta]|nr:hypothetical protein C8R45DRAFT_948411 [Mycena sanguinolenta]